jgi:hypothetical protein
VIALPHGERPETCPVLAVLRWIELRACSAGPLFVGVRYGEQTGRRLDAARILKRRAVAAGLAPRQLSGHSLRAGLATAAALAGKAPQDIQRHLRHRSLEQTMRYVRRARAFVDNVAAGIGLASTWPSWSSSGTSPATRCPGLEPEGGSPSADLLRQAERRYRTLLTELLAATDAVGELRLARAALTPAAAFAARTATALPSRPAPRPRFTPTAAASPRWSGCTCSGSAAIRAARATRASRPSTRARGGRASRPARVGRQTDGRAAGRPAPCWTRRRRCVPIDHAASPSVLGLRAASNSWMLQRLRIPRQSRGVLES